jgi:hypothetical protein
MRERTDVDDLERVDEVADDQPIACTIRPGDDEDAMMDRYRTLFADADVARERTASGVRWTFRAGDGVEARVRELAAMEAACCAFLRVRVTAAGGTGGEVLWDLTGPERARAFLDEYFRLPETMWEGVERLGPASRRPG